MSTIEDKIVVENINTPGKTSRVNRKKYEAMKKAMLDVMPTHSPGLNQNEIRNAILPQLDEEVFPGGDKSAWWAKTVQLDLEAKGILIRETTKPLRWYRVS